MISSKSIIFQHAQISLVSSRSPCFICSSSSSPVDHEIAENVSSAQTGGKLGSQANCRDCPKNKQLNHHQHLIPASEFQRQDLDTKWSSLNLRGKLTLNHCYNLIKLLIPLCVRLESEYVSEDRPAERYPLSEKRGETLCLSKNVGSGWISGIESKSEFEYVCIDCGDEWNVYCYKGVYDCPDIRTGCRGKWRVRSEDRKCPECDSDAREDVEGR